MSKDIDHRWTYYDAVLDEVHFEWPDPFGDTEEAAKQDCIKYLNQILGKYHMKTFQRRDASS